MVPVHGGQDGDSCGTPDDTAGVQTQVKETKFRPLWANDHSWNGDSKEPMMTKASTY